MSELEAMGNAMVIGRNPVVRCSISFIKAELGTGFIGTNSISRRRLDGKRSAKFLRYPDSLHKHLLLVHCKTLRENIIFQSTLLNLISVC